MDLLYYHQLKKYMVHEYVPLIIRGIITKLFHNFSGGLTKPLLKIIPLL